MIREFIIDQLYYYKIIHEYKLFDYEILIFLI